MGFFGKVFGTAAVVGATVGSFLYVKNRRETRDENEVFEDLSNEKYIDYNSDDSAVHIKLNIKKAKQTADYMADKIIDSYDGTVEKVTGKIGEEKAEKIKDNYETAKGKVTKAAKVVSDAAIDAKDKAVDKIGEERIDEVKDKVKDVVNDAKDIIKDKVTPDNVKPASATDKKDESDKPEASDTVDKAERSDDKPDITAKAPEMPKTLKQTADSDKVDFMEDELDSF